MWLSLELGRLLAEEPRPTPAVDSFLWCRCEVVVVMAGGWGRLFGWGLSGFWFSFFRSLANPSGWMCVSGSRARVTPAFEASRRWVSRCPKAVGSVRSLLFDASGTSLVSSCVVSGGVSFGVPRLSLRFSLSPSRLCFLALVMSRFASRSVPWFLGTVLVRAAPSLRGVFGVGGGLDFPWLNSSSQHWSRSPALCLLWMGSSAGIRQGLDVVGEFGPLAGLVSMSVDAHEAFLELFSVESDF
ncbi:hypothetical protein DY000_02038712 [Brassica cretica]|uniref:Uncharacterized protein n=1 Tax=Brassica cretica TaxID=69181 RepID=A0ABQ7BEK6_BRACR|nr:hypothetical protein DY000_02038712 [Brassica cretica]